MDKDQTIKKFYMMAADTLNVQYQREFINDLQTELNNPEFEKASERTDWRTYIIDEVCKNWHFVDELSRLLFWFSAMDRVKENDEE